MSLGEADVLDEMPGRVGHVRRVGVDGVVREVRDGLQEGHVGAVGVE